MTQWSTFKCNIISQTGKLNSDESFLTKMVVVDVISVNVVFAANFNNGVYCVLSYSFNCDLQRCLSDLMSLFIVLMKLRQTIDLQITKYRVYPFVVSKPWTTQLETILIAHLL